MICVERFIFRLNQFKFLNVRVSLSLDLEILMLLILSTIFCAFILSPLWMDPSPPPHVWRVGN